MALNDLMITGRKFGCITYSYSAKKVGAVGSENPKVVITARDDLTGELIMDTKTDLNSVKENGLPLPDLNDIFRPKSSKMAVQYI